MSIQKQNFNFKTYSTWSILGLEVFEGILLCCEVYMQSCNAWCLGTMPVSWQWLTGILSACSNEIAVLFCGGTSMHELYLQTQKY